MHVESLLKRNALNMDTIVGTVVVFGVLGRAVGESYVQSTPKRNLIKPRKCHFVLAALPSHHQLDLNWSHSLDSIHTCYALPCRVFIICCGGKVCLHVSSSFDLFLTHCLPCIRDNNIDDNLTLPDYETNRG